MKENVRTLKQVLEMAFGQRAHLARGDLEAVRELQAARQRLLEGIQSIDGEDAEEKATISEILRHDQVIRRLLSSELTDIHRKMQTITSVKRLLHTRRATRKGTPRYVSRRI